MRWFAAEIVVIVAGVLIALALNAWWQGRQEADLERAYLEQLHADLVASEEGLAGAVWFFEVRASAAAGIVHSFWQDDLPPQDSLATWMLRSLTSWRFRPALGTAEAIVSTGDLRLVSDDSLRTMTVRYIDNIEANLEDAQRYDETYYRAARALLPDEFNPAALSVMLRDSTDDPPSPLAGAPQDFDRVPFPIDFDTVMTDPQLYKAFSSLLVAHRGTMGRYESMLRRTQRLRAHVKRALAR